MTKNHKHPGFYVALKEAALVLGATAALVIPAKQAQAGMAEMNPTEQKVAMAVAQKTGADIAGLDVQQKGSLISVDYQQTDDGRGARGVFGGAGYRVVVDTASESDHSLVTNYEIKSIPHGRGIKVVATVFSMQGAQDLVSAIGTDQGRLDIPDHLQVSPDMTPQQKDFAAFLVKTAQDAQAKQAKQAHVRPRNSGPGNVLGM